MAENNMRLGLPDGMQMQRRDGELILVYNWLGTKHFFAILNLVVLCGFYWFSIGDLKLDLDSIWQNKMQLFLLLLITGSGYHVLLGFINKTRLQVNRTRVRVSHDPLPCLLPKTMQTSDFAQLYVKQDVHQSRSSNNTDVSFRVQVISKQGKTLTLVKGIQSSEDALYIEQEIESYLGIKDLSVKGELQ